MFNVLPCSALMKTIIFISVKSLKHNYVVTTVEITVYILKGGIFWHITSCSPLKVNLRFGITIASIFSVEKYAKIFPCYLFHAGFLLVTTVEKTVYSMKSTIFWDVIQCSPLKVSRRFCGTCRLRLQGRKIGQVLCLLPGEDGGDMFLRNIV
jgi:hypothetical protein